MRTLLRARRPRITGNNRVQFLFQLTEGPASGFSTNVDDLRAVSLHPQRMSHRDFRFQDSPSENESGVTLSTPIITVVSEIEPTALKFPDHEPV